jgi:tripartite ATP-independent transporter DctM subunit
MLLVGILFLFFLAIGMPIAYAIGISGVAFFLQHPELPLTMIAQLPISQTQNFTLLAVPLFILAGNLMNASGITNRLVKLASVLTGHMRGGLAQVNVVLSTLMGGVSGSAIADASMEARILAPSMIKQGYSRGFSANCTAWTALITATIPPGVGIILYGTTGEVSIGRLFAAGIFTGIFLMAVYMFTVWIIATRRGYKTETHEGFVSRADGRNQRECLGTAVSCVLLVGLRSGIFHHHLKSVHLPCICGACRCLRLQGTYIQKPGTDACVERARCRRHHVHHCAFRHFSGMASPSSGSPIFFQA